MSSRCLGFGEKDGTCDKPAGSSHSPLWCQECDEKRRESITRDLAAITEMFEECGDES